MKIYGNEDNIKKAYLNKIYLTLQETVNFNFISYIKFLFYDLN
jgi:hypothetical protein